MCGVRCAVCGVRCLVFIFTYKRREDMFVVCGVRFGTEWSGLLCGYLDWRSKWSHGVGVQDNTECAVKL